MGKFRSVFFFNLYIQLHIYNGPIPISWVRFLFMIYIYNWIYITDPYFYFHIVLLKYLFNFIFVHPYFTPGNGWDRCIVVIPILSFSWTKIYIITAINVTGSAASGIY